MFNENTVEELFITISFNLVTSEEKVTKLNY